MHLCGYQKRSDPPSAYFMHPIFFIKCRADSSERWLDASWIDVHGIRGQIARNAILPVTAVCLWVILLIAALPVNPALARETKSRQKPRGMSDFCLPDSPKSARADPKVEQNLQNSEKCSTRLPSPKPCGLRLRANSKKQRFARNRGQVQWLSKWCAALPLAKSLPFTDKSMKMGSLSVNGPLEKYRLRTKWSKIAVCP